MNSTETMKLSVRPVVMALALMNIVLVGAITVFQEHNTLKSRTFITNQSLKMVMATVRFENVSESVRSFPDLLVATLDFGCWWRPGCVALRKSTSIYSSTTATTWSSLTLMTLLVSTFIFLSMELLTPQKATRSLPCTEFSTFNLLYGTM